jgi:arginase
LLASTLPHCLKGVGGAPSVGLNVTIYDPDLDPEGTAGALLTDVVVAAFDRD